MGVAMFDCATVIVYIVVWVEYQPSFALCYSALSCQEKAKETFCSCSYFQLNHM